MDLTVEGYFASRPDITPEMMEKARRLTEEKIRAYELKQARKACAMTQQEIAEQGVRILGRVRFVRTDFD